MASNTAKIEMTADSESVIRALQKVERGFDRITARLEQNERETRKFTSSNDKRFSKMVEGAKAAALSIAGITSATGLASAGIARVAKEMENLRSRQQGAANEGIGFEESLSQAVRNASGIFSAEQVRNMSMRMARETGVNPARAASTIGSAITSTGVTNQAEARLAVQAAQDALKFAPDLDASGVEAISGISASLAKRFGVRPSAAIGFVQRVGGQANIRETAPLIENLAPVIANLTEFGFSPTEAGALASTITQGTGDVTGELSGTAAVNLADSLNKAFPGVAPGEAIKRLQGDPAAREAFLDGGKIDGRKVSQANLGKGKAKPTIRGLLTAGSVQAEQFAGSQTAIGGFAEGQETFDSLIDDIRSVTPLSQLKRAIGSGVSQMKILDTSGGKTSIVREGLQEALKAAGASDLEQSLNSIIFEGASGINQDNPEEFLVKRLQRKARSLRTDLPSQSIDTGLGQAEIPGRAATNQEKRVADALDVIAGLVQQQLEDQRRRDPPAQRREPAAAALGRR